MEENENTEQDESRKQQDAPDGEAEAEPGEELKDEPAVGGDQSEVGETAKDEDKERAPEESGEEESRRGDTKKLPQEAPHKGLLEAAGPGKAAGVWPVVGLLCAIVALLCWAVFFILFTRKAEGAATTLEEVVVFGSLALGFILTPVALVSSITARRKDTAGALRRVTLTGYVLSLVAGIPFLFVLFTVLMMLWVVVTA